MRKSLAAGSQKKIPHIVSLEWVEESWKHGTLLDEESKFSSLLFYIYSALGDLIFAMPLTAIF